MPDKKMKNENMPAPDAYQEGDKIGFKNQKPVREDSTQMETRWKKIESVVGAAKEAYQSGKSDFGEVLGSLIATLQDMLNSEVGGKDLGGLMMNGPEMNLPPEPPLDDQQQQ
jgi:phosphate/sulfate permease